MADQAIRTRGHTYQNITTEDLASAHLGDVHHHHGLAQDERIKALLLESLSFPEMRRRRDDVMETKQETWLYDDTVPDTWGDKTRARTLLTGWLENDSDKLFWVSGKPGSGKSVFMKNLRSHANTTASLRDWAGSKTLLVLEHYFWVAGAPIQSSWLGLLRTLLHDCVSALTVQDDLILLKAVFSDRWNFRSQHIPWTSAVVQNALQQIWQSASFKIVVFIDGLDECQPRDDHDVVVETLLKLCKFPEMKICASGRPWPAFEQGFEMSPCIKLHDLTWEDMCIYVHDNLVRAESTQRLVRDFREGTAEAKNFVLQIVEKAEGVYLWTNLVLGRISSEQRKGRALDRLQACLDSMPEGLEGYFKSLVWGRIPGLRSNKTDTACVLFLALNAYRHSYAPSFDWGCLPYYLLSRDQLQPDLDMYSIHPRWHCSLDAEGIHDHISLYLGETCGDLLYLEKSCIAPIGDGKIIPLSIVTFTHRTVSDFLETDEIQTFLASYVPIHFLEPSFWKKAELHIAGHLLFAISDTRYQRESNNQYCRDVHLLLERILEHVEDSGDLHDPAPHQQDWLSGCDKLAVEHLQKVCLCSGNDHIVGVRMMRFRCYDVYRYANRVLQKWPYIALYGKRNLGSILESRRHRQWYKDPTLPLVNALRLVPGLGYGKSDTSTIATLLDFGCDPNQTHREEDVPPHSVWELVCARWWNLVDEIATIQDVQHFIEPALLLIRHGARTWSPICVTDHTASSNSADRSCHWVDFTAIVQRCVPAGQRPELLRTTAEHANMARRHRTHRKQKLLAFRSMRTSLTRIHVGFFSAFEERCSVTPLNAKLWTIGTHQQSYGLIDCFSGWLDFPLHIPQCDSCNHLPPTIFREACVCLDCAGFPTICAICARIGLGAHHDHYGLLISQSEGCLRGLDSGDLRSVFGAPSLITSTTEKVTMAWTRLFEASNRWFLARAEEHGVAISEPPTADDPFGHPSIPASPEVELHTVTEETADDEFFTKYCLVRL